MNEYFSDQVGQADFGAIIHRRADHLGDLPTSIRPLEGRQLDVGLSNSLFEIVGEGSPIDRSEFPRWLRILPMSDFIPKDYMDPT